ATLRSGRDDTSVGCRYLESPNEVSSRPERTRISCHAALDRAACAPFCKGKAHEVHQRHRVPREIRGSVVEGPAVSSGVNIGIQARHANGHKKCSKVYSGTYESWA